MQDPGRLSADGSLSAVAPNYSDVIGLYDIKRKTETVIMQQFRQPGRMYDLFNAVPPEKMPEYVYMAPAVKNGLVLALYRKNTLLKDDTAPFAFIYLMTGGNLCSTSYYANRPFICFLTLLPKQSMRKTGIYRYINTM